MNNKDMKLRLEKLENMGARVAVFIQRDLEALEERIRALEQKEIDND